MSSRLCGVAIVAAGLVVFAPSLSVPFVFDDWIHIVENPRIRTLMPPWAPLLGTPRPLTDWTFAWNYARGGLAVRGYHLVNLGVHLLTSLTLFGLARRTLARPPRRAPAANGQALAIALLWAVHPLQTESVTYLVQRAELLAGLGALVTLYATLRSTTSAQPRRWQAAAMLSHALALAAKPVAVLTPLLVGLYDRVYLAGSWRAAWHQRRGLYLGLVAGWGVLGMCLTQMPRGPGVGDLGAAPMSVWAYAANQPAVILHYLRLAIWPTGLVIDYGWPVASTIWASLVPASALAGLAIATWWLWRTHRPSGFFALWTWLTLLPSSSLVPMADLAAEHRMYLPLAGLVALGVVGAEGVTRRVVASRALRSGVLAVWLVGCATALGVGTIRRHAAYRSELALWQDVARKRPANPRGHNNLGGALAAEGAYESALVEFSLAATLASRYPDAWDNLGLAWMRRGRWSEAAACLAQAVRLEPDDAELRNNLGAALAYAGHLEDAMTEYQRALQLSPRYVDAQNNLGNALARQGRWPEALAAYQRGVELDPTDQELQLNRAVALEAVVRSP